MNKAEMKIVRFDTNDVIATSGNGFLSGEYRLTGIGDDKWYNAKLIDWNNSDVTSTYLTSSYNFKQIEEQIGDGIIYTTESGSNLSTNDESYGATWNGIYTYQNDGNFYKQYVKYQCF